MDIFCKKRSFLSKLRSVKRLLTERTVLRTWRASIDVYCKSDISSLNHGWYLGNRKYIHWIHVAIRPCPCLSVCISLSLSVCLSLSLSHFVLSVLSSLDFLVLSVCRQTRKDRLSLFVSQCRCCQSVIRPGQTCLLPCLVSVSLLSDQERSVCCLALTASIPADRAQAN